MEKEPFILMMKIKMPLLITSIRMKGIGKVSFHH
jgi:hypothetical protein